MLIDWFTVGAQALNFVILVWLMKRFLYKPVLDAIEAREQRIAAEQAEADATKASAQKDRDEWQQKSAAFDHERAALMSQATDEAKRQRQHLLDDARSAADALAATRQQTMDSDAKALHQALRQRTQAEVFAIARQALGDLATATLEASACGVFILRLRALEGTAKDELARALKASPASALVRSAFDLPPAQQAALRNAVNETFAMALDLRYELAPALVSGIELSAHGCKFAWSIADYLGTLERSVGELLSLPA